MKRNKFIGLAVTLIAALAANATVYLTKEGKVVASFEDEEVDAITFEDPSEYDLDTECVLLQETYYSDAMSDKGYNYYLYLSDMEYNDKGLMPVEANMVTLRLLAPEPEAGGTLSVPAGTYHLGTETFETGTIRPGTLSYVRINGGECYFKSAVCTVSYDSNGRIDLILRAVGTEGQNYKAHYHGGYALDDQSLDWLYEDVDLTTGTVTATYLQESVTAVNNCNINIMIAENGYEDTGWLKVPNNLITFVGRVNLTSDGKFEAGTWEIIDGDYASDNTLLAGRVANLMGASFPVNTNVKHYIDQENIEVGLVKSGTASITELDGGMYRLTYDFVTHTGKTVKGRYVGRIEIKDVPIEDTNHLTSDYELTYDDTTTGKYYTWGNEHQLELVTYNQNYQYIGDRVDIRLTPKNQAAGFRTGVYKLTDDGDCIGTIIPGKFHGSWSENSVFLKYTTTGDGEILKGSGITDGTVEIIDAGDGNYTVILDLVDDQPEKHRITGTWTGPFTFGGY